MSRHKLETALDAARRAELDFTTTAMLAAVTPGAPYAAMAAVDCAEGNRRGAERLRAPLAGLPRVAH